MTPASQPVAWWWPSKPPDQLPGWPWVPGRWRTTLESPSQSPMDSTFFFSFAGLFPGLRVPPYEAIGARHLDVDFYTTSRMTCWNMAAMVSVTDDGYDWRDVIYVCDERWEDCRKIARTIVQFKSTDASHLRQTLGIGLSDNWVCQAGALCEATVKCLSPV